MMLQMNNCKIFIGAVIFFLSVSCSWYADGENTEIFEIDEISPKRVGESMIIACLHPNSIINVEIYNPLERLLQHESAEVGRVVAFVRSLTLDSGGTYRCSGYNSSSNNTTVEVTRNVIVYDPISFTNVERIQYFELGEDAVINCSSNGNPKGFVKWIFRQSDFTPENSFNTSARIHIDSNNSSLVIQGINKSDEGNYTCRVTENDFSQLIEKVVQVIVEYPPKTVITSPDQVLMNGDNLTLHCQADAYPASIYRWYRESSSKVFDIINDGMKSNDGSVLFIANISLFFSGNYVCEARNKRGNSTNATTVTVKAPPAIISVKNASVNDGEPAFLECSASGFPLPVVKIYHKNREIVKNVTYYIQNGLNVTRFNIPKSLPRNFGFYLCKVNNELGSDFATMFLEVFYAPQERSFHTKHACINGTATFVCKFDAYPKAELSWTKMTSASRNDINENFTVIYEAAVPLKTGKYSVYEVNGTSHLIMNRISDDMYGSYVCLASNSVGRNKAIANLTKAAPPDPPRIIKIVEITATEALLKFAPPKRKSGFEPVTDYTIRKKINSEEVVIESGFMNKIHRLFSDSFSYRLTNLRYGTKYTLSMAAVSCAGEGKQSKSVSFKTKKIFKPEAIVITSDAISSSPHSYTLTWQIGDDGGSVIDRIDIMLSCKVQTMSSYSTIPYFEVHTLRPNDFEFSNSSINFENLNSSFVYLVKLAIYNKAGGAATLFTFETPEAFTASQTKTTPLHPKSGLICIVVTVIVTIVVILVITELYLFKKYHCGLFYCLTTGRSSCVSEEPKESQFDEGSGDCNDESEESPLRSKELLKNGDGGTENQKKKLSPEEIKLDVIEKQAMA